MHYVDINSFDYISCASFARAYLIFSYINGKVEISFFIVFKFNQALLRL
jgi:hypothetical protein